MAAQSACIRKSDRSIRGDERKRNQILCYSEQKKTENLGITESGTIDLNEQFTTVSRPWGQHDGANIAKGAVRSVNMPERKVINV